MNEKDNFEMEKNGYHVNYQNAHFFPQASQILDPYWNSTPGPSSLNLGWNPNPSEPFQKPVNFLPPSFSDIQADSGFIERAAKYSCFIGGNVSAILGTINSSEPINISDQNRIKENLIENRKRDSDKSEAGEAECSGVGEDEVSNAANNKKKRRANQGKETNQAEGITRGENNVDKEENNIGKDENVGTEIANNNDNNNNNNKEDYVHVRARRGQATTSHSLAERLRREKISERMKYLQDLVPGCSKVTGKAVMLDEIINYVQSLQRQVEFLSMKLSAINPRLDFNIEDILSKSLFNPHMASSSAMGLLAVPDLVQHHLHMSRQNLVQQPNVTNSQLCTNNGYKDPPTQISIAWDGELHNVMQMVYPPHELNTKSQDGFQN